MLATAVGRSLRAAFLCDRHCAGTRSYGSSRLCVPLQPLQVGSHVGGVLIAQIAVLLQRLVDDPFQFGGHIGIQPHGGTGARFRWLRR